MSASIDNREFAQALLLAFIALLVSAALVAAIYLALAQVFHPEFQRAASSQPGKPIQIPGASFQIAVADDGGYEGTAAVIREPADLPTGIRAVLVHRLQFKANQFPFLRLRVDGRHSAMGVTVYWRRAATPGQLYSADLDSHVAGSHSYNLFRHKEWRGTITELAVGFLGDFRGDTVKLHRVVLEPYSASALLQTVWDEWQTSEPRGQRSINLARGAEGDALVYPVPAATAWITVAIVLLAAGFLLRGRRFGRPAALAIICVVALGWLALDAMWTRKLTLNHNELRYFFAGKSVHERKLADWDGALYDFVDTIKRNYLPREQQNIAVLRQRGQGTAYARRLRYHLLPEHHVTWMPVATDRKFAIGERYDYVVLLADAASLQSGTISVPAAMGLQTNGRETLVYAKGNAALYRIASMDLRAENESPAQ